MLILPVVTKNDHKQIPIACIALILINAFIYFFIQSGDGIKIHKAWEYYKDSGLMTIEMEAYRGYLLQKGKSAPEKLSQRIEQRYGFYRQMIEDDEFCSLLVKNRIITPDKPRFKQWRKKRDKYESLKKKAVIYRFGYLPREKNTIGLFTCMYLHGSVMHIVGNMVFLWMVGAFLEAAVGGVWFFVLYSITGVCASALFGVVYPLSSGPLIGASGAIAGLMGAYGVIFGLRKIRIFYSLGFYFDYASVPALALFPFWLGNEFFQLYTNKGSHVAYMAHVGGLISGIFIGTGIRIKKKDQIASLFYREQQKSRVESLFDSAMDKLVALDFANARSEFNKLLDLEPENMKALRQVFIIDKNAPQSQEFHQSAHRLLARLENVDPDEYLAVFEEYKNCSGKPRVTIEMLERLSHLYLSTHNIKQASACVSALIKRVPENGKIPSFLFTLARGYKQNNKKEASQKCLRILASKYPSTFEGGEAVRLLGS